MTNPLDRALALAKRRNVDTRAQTLRGVMRAIRSAPPPPRTQRRSVGRARRNLRWADPTALLRPPECDRGQRARVAGPSTLVCAALQAALGHPFDHHGAAMPNRYRYPAYETVITAERVGRVVLLYVARDVCPTVSGGGGRVILASDTRRHAQTMIRASDLLRVLPRLPDGARWAADALGVKAVTRDGAEYHPLGRVLRLAVQGDAGELLACVSAGLERARATARPADDVVARALAARATNPDRVVTLADSVAAGNCAAGTRAWARMHGMPAKGVRVGDIPARLLQDVRVARVIAS